MKPKVSKENARQWLDRVCKPLERLPLDNDYLVENRFSAANVVTGGVLIMGIRIGNATRR